MGRQFADLCLARHGLPAVGEANRFADTQVAGHHMNVIKALPALTVEEGELRRFAEALAETIAAAQRYPAALARFGLRAGIRSTGIRSARR